MKLLVLDGNSLVNRAYFGIKLLTTKDGRYTNAIFGFQNILLNLLSAHHPDAVAIAWDEKAPTFRHTAYDGYKATRHGMPQELAEQMPVLKQLLTDLGFVQVSKPGWEADDILGTLAAANEAAGGTTLLATGDRDSLQLVDDATTVLLATNRETLPMDPAAIQEKYGVAPPQLIEVKSLMGDASDNIPGVPGIGEKTALALVQKFGSLQGVYEHLDDKAIKPKQREKLEANKELAELSHMLGTIRKDAPIETAPEHYCRTAGDPAAAAQLLAELEMHKLTARWGLDESPAAVAASAEPLPEVQPDLLPLAPEGRYDLAQNKDGSWYAVQGDSVYLLDNDRLPSLLDAAGVQLRVFDAKPLYHIALEHGGVGAAIVFDGKLAAYLLNPSASDYQAGQLAAEYAAAPAFACAAAPDAGALSALLDVLSTKLDEQGGHDLLATMELPLARVLADMERIGFAVDAEGIRQFGDSLRAELNGILQNIYAEVGYEFNLNSPKQLGEALFDKLGLPPRKKTARGYSTDAETLESLRAYSPDAAFAMLEMKQKEGPYQKKRSLRLTREDAARLCRGDYFPLLTYKEPFAAECYGLMNCRCYRPRAIVEYRRQAYIARENHIRVTLDSQIMATESCWDVFSPRLPLYPVMDSFNMVLEVKYNGFLLSYIKSLLDQVERTELSVSKYCLARRISLGHES